MMDVEGKEGIRAVINFTHGLAQPDVILKTADVVVCSLFAMKDLAVVRMWPWFGDIA